MLLMNQSQSTVEERRAKSSLGENSATRLRTKVIGNNPQKQLLSNQQLALQQMRSNASSAMARLQPGVGMLRNPTSSSNQLEDGAIRPLLPKASSNLDGSMSED